MFPDSPPPVGIYGCFGDQQLLEGFVGICAELHCVCWGETLSDLEVAAMGEMLVGIPSRNASAISALNWDEVSTSWSSSFGWWEGGIRTTTWCGLLRVELLDPWPDISSITWVKRSLTSLVMLPSPSDFGWGGLMGLAIRMVETSPRGSTFWSGSSTVGGGMSISR